MSKRETPMTVRYWKQVGGLLIDEYPIVKASPTCSPGWLDGVILLGHRRRRLKGKRVSLDGEQVIIVQTKARRLGMPLMGQAVYSLELVKRHFKPKSIRSVALCLKDDSELGPLLKK